MSYYAGYNYAIRAMGGFNINFEDIVLSSQYVVEQYDITDSIQVTFDVRTFNEKLGVIKDGSNIHVLETSFNDYTGEYENDSIYISASDLVNGIDASSVLTVGFYTTVYSDFVNYVRTYFGYPGGFSSLYKQAKRFNINNGIFDASAFITLISGGLTGYFDISNINPLFRNLVDSNAFGNRDTSGGTTASDWLYPSNYGIGDGFLVGDLIFIPQGTTIKLSVGIAPESFTNNINNVGPNFTQNTDYVSANTYFSIETIASTHLISRTLTAPLLLKLVDSGFASPSDVFIGNIYYYLDYTTFSVKITVTDSSYNFFIATWNNGYGKSGKIYDTSYIAPNLILYETYIFYVTPFLNVGARGVGVSKSITFSIEPIITKFYINNISGTEIQLIWSGLYNTSVLYDSSFNIINSFSNDKIVYTIDASYNIGELMPYINYSYYVVPKDIVGNSYAASSVVSARTIPAILSATIVDICAQSIRVKWTGGYYSALLYNVSGGSLVATTLATATYMDTSYNITGLMPYINYSYYVLPKDDGGNSYAASSTVSTRTIPAILSATIVDICAQSIRVNWTGGYYSALIYNVSGGSLVTTTLATAPYMDTSYNITGLMPYINYSYYVVPKDDGGNSYAASSTVSTRTIPAILSAVITDICAQSIRVNWTGGYYSALIYNVSGGSLVTTTLATATYMDTSYNITGLMPYINYSYYVVPKDDGGNSYAASSVVSTRTNPAILSATIVDICAQSIRVKWTGGYYSALLYNVSGGSLVTTNLATTPYMDTSYNITGLMPYINYSYYVLPKDDGGNSYVASSVVATRTNPAILSAVITDICAQSIRVKWTGGYYSALIYNVSGGSPVTTTLSTSPYMDTSYNITGLLPYNNYSYYVLPKDDGGNSYVASSVVAARTNPAILDISAVFVITDVSKTSLYINWVGYYYSSLLYQNTGLVVTKTAITNYTDTSYNIIGLTINTLYTFYVVPKDDGGNSYTASSTISVTTPLPVTGLIATPNRTAISVQFTAPAAGTVSSYTLYTTTGRTITGTTTPLNVTGLTRRTLYTLYIITLFTNGYKSISARITSTTT
jgi:hypothetical protein